MASERFFSAFSAITSFVIAFTTASSAAIATQITVKVSTILQRYAGVPGSGAGFAGLDSRIGFSRFFFSGTGSAADASDATGSGSVNSSVSGISSKTSSGSPVSFWNAIPASGSMDSSGTPRFSPLLYRGSRLFLSRFFFSFFAFFSTSGFGFSDSSTKANASSVAGGA